LALRDDPAGVKKLFRWRIARGGTASAGDFLDPVAGATLLGICVYDASASAQPLLAGTLVSGGTCDGRPCWRHASGGVGYRFKSRAGTSDGIRSLKLGASRAGDLKLSLTAKGPAVAVPPLGLAAPVRVQLQMSDDQTTVCWESVFESPSRNDTRLFKAKSAP
jgi:hypothetical protein